MSSNISSISSKFGQYFNFGGIIYTLYWMINPVLFKPHFWVRTIAEIDFTALRENGIKYIVFDKDNTLTLPYEKDFHPSVLENIKLCKKEYSADNIAILSNSAGSGDDKKQNEAKEIEQSLGIKVMNHLYKKPNWVQDIYKAFTKNDQPPPTESVAVIGDRITADIIMGNRAGFLTIHTQPFSIQNENFLVKSARLFEDKVLLNMSRKQNIFKRFEELKDQGELKDILRPHSELL